MFNHEKRKTVGYMHIFVFGYEIKESKDKGKFPPPSQNPGYATDCRDTTGYVHHSRHSKHLLKTFTNRTYICNTL